VYFCTSLTSLFQHIVGLGINIRGTIIRTMSGRVTGPCAEKISNSWIKLGMLSHTRYKVSKCRAYFVYVFLGDDFVYVVWVPLSFYFLHMSALVYCKVNTSKCSNFERSPVQYPKQCLKRYIQL
jgi:hypothetical protein